MKYRSLIDRTFIRATSGGNLRARRIGIVPMIALGLAGPLFAQSAAEQRLETVQRKKPEQIEPVRSNGYTTVFYKSGRLNIEAYLYRPKGDGLFPLVIYN